MHAKIPQNKKSPFFTVKPADFIRSFTENQSLELTLRVNSHAHEGYFVMIKSVGFTVKNGDFLFCGILACKMHAHLVFRLF